MGYEEKQYIVFDEGKKVAIYFTTSKQTARIRYKEYCEENNIKHGRLSAKIIT